jgi:hypothetical protein
MNQFRGRNDHGEWLVTVFPAEGSEPACAEVAWRADEWDTFDAPVKLKAAAS